MTLTAHVHLSDVMRAEPGGLIYLSGPMTGIPDDNEPAFSEARDYLAYLFPAANIISPPDLGDAGTWALNLRRDVHYVADATALVVIDGWRESKGATLEVHIAERLEIPIFEYPKLCSLS